MAIKFTSISAEDYNKILKMLKACGFKNKSPLDSALTNELLFYRPEIAQQIIINPLENKTELIPKNENFENNNEVCGQYGFDKVYTVDPAKLKNPFENISDLKETIDEDELLKAEEKYVPFQKAEDSCATKPKACKNCSCGRKELE